MLTIGNVRSITSYVRIFKLRSALDVFIVMKVAHLKFLVFVFGGMGDDHLAWFHRSQSACHVLSTLGPSRLVRWCSCRFLCGKCAVRISTKTRAIQIEVFMTCLSTSIRLRSHPFKPFPIYYSPFTVPLDAVYSARC